VRRFERARDGSALSSPFPLEFALVGLADFLNLRARRSWQLGLPRTHHLPLVGNPPAAEGAKGSDGGPGGLGLGLRAGVARGEQSIVCVENLDQTNDAALVCGERGITRSWRAMVICGSIRGTGRNSIRLGKPHGL
jgi:hypothetical protein